MALAAGAGLARYGDEPLPPPPPPPKGDGRGGSLYGGGGGCLEPPNQKKKKRREKSVQEIVQDSSAFSFWVANSDSHHVATGEEGCVNESAAVGLHKWLKLLIP